jgi:nucleoside-diphosphate-sugar epimerase
VLQICSPKASRSDFFYAVRSTENITLRELLETLKERAGLDLHFDWGAIEYWPGQIFEPWEGDFLPGWRPSVPLVDGIVELLRGAASSRLPESIAALHNELP